MWAAPNRDRGFRLDLGQAAVDGELGARDVGGVVRGQEQHRARHIRRASPSGRAGSSPRRRRAPRPSRARAPVSGVSTAPGLTTLTRMPPTQDLLVRGERAGQAAHGGLAGEVERIARAATRVRRRRREHDRRPRPEERQRPREREEHPFEVHGDDPIEERARRSRRGAGTPTCRRWRRARRSRRGIPLDLAHRRRSISETSTDVGRDGEPRVGELRADAPPARRRPGADDRQLAPPRAANARAAASPIPLLPPVMTTTLSWNLMVASRLVPLAARTRRPAGSSQTATRVPFGSVTGSSTRPPAARTAASAGPSAATRK